jgi:hypothetical protein
MTKFGFLTESDPWEHTTNLEENKMYSLASCPVHYLFQTIGYFIQIDNIIKLHP